jgi:hypothetical protein
MAGFSSLSTSISKAKIILMWMCEVALSPTGCDIFTRSLQTIFLFIVRKKGSANGGFSLEVCDFSEILRGLSSLRTMDSRAKGLMRNRTEKNERGE